MKKRDIKSEDDILLTSKKDWHSFMIELAKLSGGVSAVYLWEMRERAIKNTMDLYKMITNRPIPSDIVEEYAEVVYLLASWGRIKEPDL